MSKKARFNIMIGAMIFCTILLASLLIGIAIKELNSDDDEELSVVPIIEITNYQYNGTRLVAGVIDAMGRSLGTVDLNYDKLEICTAMPERLSMEDQIGNDEIKVNGVILVSYSLPDIYYPNIDFQSMQPFMSYKRVTNKATEAYEICHSDKSYVDENGLLRHEVGDEQFSINGQDDYVIALGTYYKERNHCGERYLIVTTTGMYTAITGDEKADKHTDSHHMVHDHNDGTYSLIEFIVDTPSLEEKVRLTGTLVNSSIEAFQGKILYIYKISEED